MIKLIVLLFFKLKQEKKKGRCFEKILILNSDTFLLNKDVRK